MTMNYKTLRIIVVNLYCFYGCACLQFPAVEKELFSWQIPKSQVEVVKNAILNNGYLRIGKDNHPYKGALTTLYEKRIVTNSKTDDRVQILLSFKEIGTYNSDSAFYKNLSITIGNTDCKENPEIHGEIERIENIIHETLLEIAGKNNVVRGPRGKNIQRDKNEKERGFFIYPQFQPPRR